MDEEQANDPFDAESYFPVEVSEDRRFITVTLTGAQGECSFRLPSPLNRDLTVALQTADATARERFVGEPDELGGVARLIVREPKKIRVSPGVLSGDLVLTFDRGTATEVSFRIPQGGALHLAKRLFAALRELSDDDPTAH